jgi:hypothetical protein
LFAQPRGRGLLKSRVREKQGRRGCSGLKRTEILSRERREEVVAGLLTTSAGIGAHPAMLVVGGVPLTLVAAQPAGFGASLEGCTRHLWLEGGLSRDYPAGGVANVGAVEVESDAAGERLGIFLAEAGVGASRATLGAVEAGLDALHQGGWVHRGGARVGLKHLLSVGHEASFLWRTCWAYPLLASHKRAVG